MKKSFLKSNNKNKAQNNKNAAWKISVIILALLLGLLMYYVAKDESAVEKDRQRFETTESKLETLTNAVVTKLGKPDAETSKNSCGRANLKSSRGPLTCSISYSYAYIVTGIEQAETMVSSVEEIIRARNDSFTVIKPLARSFKQVPANIKTPGIDSDFTADNEGMRCGATYYYVPANAFFGNLIADPNKENISINIGCGDGARAEYYPSSN